MQQRGEVRPTPLALTESKAAQIRGWLCREKLRSSLRVARTWRAVGVGRGDGVEVEGWSRMFANTYVDRGAFDHDCA